MRAAAAGVTDVGRERDHNEDRFVLVPDHEVFVVADGMGGHQCGEVASRMATSFIAKHFREEAQLAADGSLGARLRASVEEANRRIFQRASSSSSHRGMGTTVVAAAFHRSQRKLFVAHAGDSRCYLFRGGKLEALTRDHSLVEEALRARPEMTKAELAYLPSNVITRALGVDATVEPDVAAHDVVLGDVFLLCSDGLHGFVPDERIREILSAQRGLAEGCADLVAEANKNGGGDNITAVLVRIEASDDPWSRPTSIPPRSSAGGAPSGAGSASSSRLARPAIVPRPGRLPSFAEDVGDDLTDEPTDEKPQAFFDIEDAPTEGMDWLESSLSDSATVKLPAKRLPSAAVLDEDTPLMAIPTERVPVSDEPTVGYDKDED